MSARTFFSPGIVLAAFLAASLAGTAGAQAVPLAKERVVTVDGKQYKLTSKLKKILMGDFFYNYNHTDGTTNLDSTLTRIGRAEGWTVDIIKCNSTSACATSAAAVTTTKLADYQVFFANYISSWASASGFPQASRSAVQDFVENKGGGVFIMHSSGDSRSGGNWPWYYSTLMPVAYTGESSRTTVSAKVGINPAAKTHPIMEGISFTGTSSPDTTVWTQGEWHTFSGNITTKVADANILMKMNPATCTKGGTGTNCGTATSTYNYGAVPGGYSATWTFPDGKGNVGYFMEGHDLVTMNGMGQANWDRFFKQFMYYIAGYDTVEVTAVGRPTDEQLVLDRSGVSFHANEPGVLITAPGGHAVALYDLSGRQLKRVVSRKVPVDYNFSDFVPRASKQGVYLLKVNIGKKSMSRRYIL